MRQQELQVCVPLDEIHRYLSKINSHVWRQLRTGVLSGCHALLYTVVLCELGEKLEWCEVNRKAVAALHHFTTATTESERCASLEAAMNCVSQKLSIAKHAGLQKAETLERDEEKAIVAARLNSYDSPVFFVPPLTGEIQEGGKKASGKWVYIRMNAGLYILCRIFTKTCSRDLIAFRYRPCRTLCGSS